MLDFNEYKNKFKQMPKVKKLSIISLLLFTLFFTVTFIVSLFCILNDLPLTIPIILLSFTAATLLFMIIANIYKANFVIERERLKEVTAKQQIELQIKKQAEEAIREALRKEQVEKELASKTEETYCTYCGSLIDSAKRKCDSCGATKKGNQFIKK